MAKMRREFIQSSNVSGKGWFYLAAVLDLATRTIVGWSMREHMRIE